MNGLYLYCVKEINKNIELKKGKIYIISFRDIEAVVSEVDLGEFNNEEINRRGQENLKWVQEKIQFHEEVVEAAMGLKTKEYSHAVIPMKFGTVFENKKNLLNILKRNYHRFKKTLKNLAKKQEWGVKVYLDKKLFEKDLKEKNSTLKEKEKKMFLMPEGIAYFQQKEMEDVVSEQMDKSLGNYIEIFFNRLKKYAAIGAMGRILEKELSGKSFPMILNAIYLIPEEKIEFFQKEIGDINKEFMPKGFIFEYNGPWPPYNFV